MERRKQPKISATPVKPTDLPVDFTRMVSDVLTSGFEEGLKALEKIGTPAQFAVFGHLYGDEIVLGASLTFGERLAATTGYASVDFDPAASSPTVEDLLSLCVDGLGALFNVLLDPKNTERLEQLSADSLGALEGIPFQWSAVEIHKRPVHLLVDKANLSLDKATDDWLAKNDPDHGKLEAQSQAEAEALAEERLEAQAAETGGKKPTFH